MGSISPKTTAATAAAALVTILTWIASLAGVDVPLEVAGALTTILVAVAAYAVRDPRRS